MVHEGEAGEDSRSRIKEILEHDAREFSIFSLLEPAEIVGMESCFRLQRHPAGSVILHEGSQVNYLGIVGTGKIEVRHRPSIEGHEMVIAHLEQGSFFGSVSSPGGRPAMAALVSEEETEVLSLSEESFNDFEQKSPQAAVRFLKGVIQVLSIRLDSAIDRVILLS